MNGNLKRALHKAKPCQNHWGGCFTPSEIFALIDDGHTSVNKGSSYYSREIERYKESIKKGESNPSWFYFHASGKNKPIHPSPTRHDKTNPKFNSIADLL